MRGSASRAAALALVAGGLLAASGAVAQEARAGTVRVERENLRAAPRGVILAEVRADARLSLGTSRDRWREATLEGWIWSRSVREERRDGFDLVVSAAGGENLRATPNGPVVARLRTGLRLERIDASGPWIRVRRTAWIWEPSVRLEPSPPPVAASSAGPREARAVEREYAALAGEREVVVVRNPAGDTLARVRPGSRVEVLAREGDWARIRVEGWLFASSLGAVDTAGLAELRDVSSSVLRDEPERYRGRLIEWNLQFVALQQAERFRTDFLEGEHFILARGPDEEPGFVYVAVPPERFDEVRRLAPLQRIRVLGRVRSARSPLTGAPVLDLLEMRPRPGS